MKSRWKWNLHLRCLPGLHSCWRPAGRCFAPGYNRCAAPHLYWKRQQPCK